MKDLAAHRDRGAVLHEQGRYDLAEREFREHLALVPDDGLGHALLALTLIESNRLPTAEQEARTAVALGPDLAFAHYALARVHVARQGFGDGVAAANEVIRIDPDHPRGYSILAAARLGQQKWAEALAATDAGLAIAPEHEGLLTERGLALRQLRRASESRAAFADVLRRDPSNSFAHASRGIDLLHDGRAAEAVDAFREALRLDPSNEMARSGLVEAMKARNPVYAALLRMMLVLGRLGGRSIILLYVGFFIAQRTLRGLAASDPSLGPLVMIVLAAYLFLVWLTYAASPLFNLLLRLDPLGRHALSDEQRLESSVVGPLVVVGFLAFVAAIITGSTAAIAVAIVGLGLVVLVAAIFACDPGWPRYILIAIAGLIVVLGFAGVGYSLAGDGSAGLTFAIGALALVAVSTWATIPLSRVRVRR